MLRLSVAQFDESNRKGNKMAVSNPNVIYVICPYCDGENAVATISSNGDGDDSHDPEMACRWCRCLFQLSEGKRQSSRSPEKKRGVA